MCAPTKLFYALTITEYIVDTFKVVTRMTNQQEGVQIPELLSAFLGGMTFLPFPSDAAVENKVENTDDATQARITCVDNHDLLADNENDTFTISREVDDEPDDMDENDSCDVNTFELDVQRAFETYGSIDDVERDLDATLHDLALAMDSVRVRSSKLSSISEEEIQLRERLKELALHREALEIEAERCSGVIDYKMQRVEVLRSVMQHKRVSQEVVTPNVSPIKEGKIRSNSMSGSGNLTIPTAVTMSLSRSTLDDELTSLDPMENRDKKDPNINQNDNYSSSSSLPDANLDIYEISTLSSESSSRNDVDECASNECSSKILSNNTNINQVVSPTEPIFSLKIGDLRLSSLTNSSRLNADIYKSMNPAFLNEITLSLVQRGKIYSMLDDKNIWKPTKETEHFFRKNSGRELNENDILVWNGKPFDYSMLTTLKGFDSKVYGTDTPVIRARGLVKTDTTSLLELLWNSERATEYNSMSLGRSDEIIFQDEVNPGSKADFSQTKVVKSMSKVPLVGKPLELYNIMHACKWEKYESVEDSSCYIIATRGLEQSKVEVNKPSQGILFSFNVIRPVKYCIKGKNYLWTELTTISHFNISGVPLFLALSVGQKSAGNFISQIQKVYESKH